MRRSRRIILGSQQEIAVISRGILVISRETSLGFPVWTVGENSRETPLGFPAWTVGGNSREGFPACTVGELHNKLVSGGGFAYGLFEARATTLPRDQLPVLSSLLSEHNSVAWKSTVWSRILNQKHGL